MANIGGPYPDPYAHASIRPPVPSLQEMLLYRLHGKYNVPFDQLTVHKVNENSYIIFVIKNGRPVTLEDDNMFPSDKIVTQLRLLLK